MAFAKTTGVIKNTAGTINGDFPNFIHTVEEGYSTTAEPKIGYFAKIDTDGKLAVDDGTGTIGVAVSSSYNLGTNCNENPIQEYVSLGCVFVGLKDGITPVRGDYIKVDGATGLADVGAVTDPFVGRFTGIYGQSSDDTTPIKCMQVQIGGM